MALEPDIYSSDHWPWIDVTWKLLVLINWCPEYMEPQLLEIYSGKRCQNWTYSQTTLYPIYIQVYFFVIDTQRDFLSDRNCGTHGGQYEKENQKLWRPFRLIFLRQYTYRDNCSWLSKKLESPLSCRHCK